MMKIVKKKQNIALNTSILLDQTNIDYKREKKQEYLISRESENNTHTKQAIKIALN